MSELTDPFTIHDVISVVRSFASERGYPPTFVITDAETARRIRDDLRNMTLHPEPGRLQRWLLVGCEWVVIQADGPFIRAAGMVYQEINR